MSADREALEVTTFRLRRGLKIDDFVAANADVDAWLLRQPGFISRRIAQGADGFVVDMLVWSSARAGEDAAARLMAELPTSPVHEVIDQRTVSWSVSPVFHRLDTPQPPFERRAPNPSDEERSQRRTLCGCAEAAPVLSVGMSDFGGGANVS